MSATVSLDGLRASGTRLLDVEVQLELGSHADLAGLRRPGFAGGQLLGLLLTTSRHEVATTACDPGQLFANFSERLLELLQLLRRLPRQCFGGGLHVQLEARLSIVIPPAELGVGHKTEAIWISIKHALGERQEMIEEHATHRALDCSRNSERRKAAANSIQLHVDTFEGEYALRTEGPPERVDGRWLPIPGILQFGVLAPPVMRPVRYARPERIDGLLELEQVALSKSMKGLARPAVSLARATIGLIAGFLRAAIGLIARLALRRARLQQCTSERCDTAN